MSFILTVASAIFMQSISYANPVDYEIKSESIKSQSSKSDSMIGSVQEAEIYLKELISSNKDRPIELSFVVQKQSLLGTHFYFVQTKNGDEIFESSAVLSVDKQGAPYHYYSSIIPNAVPIDGFRFRVLKNDSDLIEKAWDHISGYGRLLEKTKVKKECRPYKGALYPFHVVDIATEGPRGYWRILISDVDGSVKSVEDRSLERKTSRASIESRLAHKNKKVDYRLAEKNLFVEPEVSGPTIDGNAQVFDPDPVTTLRDANLQDNAPASAFSNAIFRVNLQDLTVVGNEVHLVGPWVKLKDFESPRTAPTTTQNGDWSFSRGENGFTDAMTYYHIDRSQRYIQSLGFVDAKGIQFGPIEVDSDGLSGQDNSHYIPGSNRLAFGHGCVDDNQDADVILHEYGHAINYSINPQFSGGDTGAMGEGFGDYWAGSGSLPAQNGDFQKYKVFNWDGASGCWEGRRMDRLTAQYNHNKNYGAHQSVGDFVSDELWSTPLFQAHVALLGLGKDRGAIDQIILEAQFGLGSRIKMRDMANSIVRAAEALYPGEEYADVFEEKFKSHKILE
ncbi:MAG: hypothetical protein KDD25_05910 [Bdellovibrionales bacterium]|nr:hypothetical protein [Bdellovibrionales bacterium]